jgi:hypothetical protein
VLVDRPALLQTEIIDGQQALRDLFCDIGSRTYDELHQLDAAEARTVRTLGVVVVTGSFIWYRHRAFDPARRWAADRCAVTTR